MSNTGETSYGWGFMLDEDTGLTHLAPTHEEHITEGCACGAAQSPEDASLIIHNSFDGREKFETGERKTS